jgi:ferredoxin
MIVAEPKPFDEIKAMVEKYDKVLVLGCGTCVSVCLTGGEREVELVSTALRLARKVEGREIEVGQQTVQRQCDFEFLDEIDLSGSSLVAGKAGANNMETGEPGETAEAKESAKPYQAIISLACGVGIQGTARKFPGIPVLPGVNTTFMGFNEEYGLYTEMCKGCGECILHLTGGVCPVARCAKSLLNGPCGGTNNSKCEVSSDKDCGWVLIYNKMKELGTLEKYKEIIGPKSYSKAGNIRSMDLRK